jgi:DNA-binding response OmpR family regulator
MTNAKGLRVFVVEDEPMIRMLLIDMLDQLGCHLAAEAGDVEKAVKLAQSSEFGLAILDVNLKGKLITPVAVLIRARELPIIFASGYGSEGLPEEFRDFPALPKPYQIDGLAGIIDKVMHPRTTGGRFK